MDFYAAGGILSNVSQYIQVIVFKWPYFDIMMTILNPELTEKVLNTEVKPSAIFYYLKFNYCPDGTAISPSFSNLQPYGGVGKIK